LDIGTFRLRCVVYMLGGSVPCNIDFALNVGVPGGVHIAGID